MTSAHLDVAEAFSRHDFKQATPYMADDIRWNNVGGQLLVGKEAVVRTCEESAAYLATVTTTFEEFRALEGPDFVVTDSRARYVEPGGDTSVVSSCDIYRFAGDRLVEITSYTVELA